jgi:predicted  nucleic acid-binding Zn-ribbon protein
MSQTLSLFRLQQTDYQIDHIQTRLLDIQKQLDDNNDLRTAKDQEDLARVHFQACEQALKQAEELVFDHRIKIEQTDASLYGGKGHNPKELQELQDDLTSLKRLQVTLEDAQLEAMFALEEAGILLETNQNLALIANDKSIELNTGLRHEQDSLQKVLQKLSSERNANADSIPIESRKQYDELRQQRRGVAVAIISDKSCSACGSGLTPALIQSARSSNQVSLCPSCGRILYGS